MRLLATGILLTTLLIACQADGQGSHTVIKRAAATPSCRLPVNTYTSYTSGTTAARGQGGFVRLPLGIFQPDPSSIGSYDRAIRAWVPAPREWVAPDGLRFVEAQAAVGSAPGEPRGTVIYIVDARTGQRTHFHLGQEYAVSAFEPEGIYLYRASFNGPWWGLWLLDPTTGGLTTVTDDKSYYWEQVGGGAAWAVQQVGGKQQGGLGPEARVLRLDLNTRRISTWLSVPTASLALIGLDGSDRPVMVLGGPEGFEIYIGRTVVYSDQRTPATEQPGTHVVADAHGLWLMGAQGRVWLYSSQRLHQVARISLDAPVVAGTCA